MMGCLNGKLDKENEDEKSRREANKKIEKQLQKDKQMYRATHRLLLLGDFPVLFVFYYVQFMFVELWLTKYVHFICAHCIFCYNIGLPWVALKSVISAYSVIDCRRSRWGGALIDPDSAISHNYIQWLHSAGTGQNTVLAPLVGVPPPQTGFPVP